MVKTKCQKQVVLIHLKYHSLHPICLYYNFKIRGIKDFSVKTSNITSMFTVIVSHCFSLKHRFTLRITLTHIPGEVTSMQKLFLVSSCVRVLELELRSSVKSSTMYIMTLHHYVHFYVQYCCVLYFKSAMGIDRF